MLVNSGAWLTVVTGDDKEEEITHTAENGYECDDPECICHEAEESNQPIPTPWEQLRERQRSL